MLTSVFRHSLIFIIFIASRDQKPFSQIQIHVLKMPNFRWDKTSRAELIHIYFLLFLQLHSGSWKTTDVLSFMDTFISLTPSPFTSSSHLQWNRGHTVSEAMVSSRGEGERMLSCSPSEQFSERSNASRHIEHLQCSRAEMKEH